jgi:DNA (cytosine-5)-methyltransferase 1
MRTPDTQTSHSETWQQCVHRGEESITRTVTIGGKKYSSTIDTSFVKKNPTKAEPDFPEELLALPEWWWAVLNGERPEAAKERGTLRVAEVFCGPGGLAQGVRQFCREAGWEFESVAAADLDAAAVDIYAQNHGPDERFTHKGRVSELVAYDIHIESELTEKLDHKKNPVKKIINATWKNGFHPQLTPRTWSGLGDEKKIDLLLAGPPCEGHSNLNNYTRRDDERNAAYLDVPALAVALDVSMVIIENVPGARHDKERVVDVARNLLENSGYWVREGVLKASKMGWPQTRSRFFMVARKKELGPPVSLEEVEEALYLDHGRKPLPVRWATDQWEDVETYEDFSDKPDGGLDRLSTPKDRPDPDDPKQINTKKRLEWFANSENEGKFDLPLDMHNKSHRPGHKRKDGTVVKKEDVTYTSVYGRMDPDLPAPTLTTGFVTPGRGRFIHPTRPRMLTPREAARLQGFPDDYRFALPSESPHEPAKPPNTNLLTKWIGDAVPMPLGYAAALWVLTPESSD